MNQKIFNNILLLIIILFIIKQLSPEPNSVLFILKKYINYFMFQIKQLLAKIGFGQLENFVSLKTFKGLPEFGSTAPRYKTSYETNFINFFMKKHPNVSENKIKKLYYYIQGLISIDIDHTFSTPSDNVPYDFNTEQKNKIEKILLNKLNKDMFKFTDFNFESDPKYYLNFSGKQVDPFVFNVMCNSDIGLLRVYVDLDIRNDVLQNKEYLVINEIKLLKDKQVVITKKDISNNNDVKIHYDADVDPNNSNPSQNFSQDYFKIDNIDDYDNSLSNNKNLAITQELPIIQNDLMDDTMFMPQENNQAFSYSQEENLYDFTNERPNDNTFIYNETINYN
uniref:Uncharacterized protein n=1 Tax=viral metagenome TaxID=1070528 RepID=A0A6C0DB59_9ZZZZ